MMGISNFFYFLVYNACEVACYMMKVTKKEIAPQNNPKSTHNKTKPKMQPTITEQLTDFHFRRNATVATRDPSTPANMNVGYVRT